MVTFTSTLTRPNSSIPWFKDSSPENLAKYNLMVQALNNYLVAENGEEFREETISDTEMKLFQTFSDIYRHTDFAFEVFAVNQTLLQSQYEHCLYNQANGIKFTTVNDQTFDVIDLDTDLLKTWYDYPA